MGSLSKNGQSYHFPVNECHRGSKVEMLYDIDDPPSHHAYEIVLNIICEEIGSNAEPASLLFLKVLALAERNKVDLSHWKTESHAGLGHVVGETRDRNQLIDLREPCATV